MKQWEHLTLGSCMGRTQKPVDHVPEMLRPSYGDCGLMSDDLAGLAKRSIRAWELFAGLADQIDMAGPTRSRGNRARDLLIGVGAWPDSRGLADMVADARAGVEHTELQSQAEERLRQAHAAESDTAIRAAVHRAVAHLREWFDSGRAEHQARLVTPSALGPVPMGTLLHATAFHLAVVARDLMPAGAPACPELDELAVVGIIDSAGAVAARLGAAASIAARTTQAASGTGTAPGRWRTVVVPPEVKHLGPAVQGPAGTLVDVAAGRVDFLAVARSVRLHHARRLVAMSIVLDGIPELPAAAMLRRTASVVRRLPL